MKTASFEIKTDWRIFNEVPSEIGNTYADLTIKINEWLASRNSECDYAKVSAYPMALWVAFYWWRLLYEPSPRINYWEKSSYNWRSAHYLTAAGDGFIWPPLCFVPSGEQILVDLRLASKPSPSYVQYNKDGHETITQSAFEKGLSAFVKNTITRLEDMGHKDTELQRLWAEVEKEKEDSEHTLYRIIEACLGFNPDEAPDELVSRLADKTKIAGRQQIFEIAAACSIEVEKSPYEAVGGIINANGNGIAASFNYDDFCLDAMGLQMEEAGNAGRMIARKLRRHLGFAYDSPIDNEKLASLFEMSPSVLADDKVSIKNLSLGVPDEKNPKHLKVYFHQEHETGRRFYLARLLAERLLNNEHPCHWLPATFGHSWRQRYQRAFANELMCPFKALDERVRMGDPNDRDIFRHLAGEYGMEPSKLKTHWEQNRYMGGHNA